MLRNHASRVGASVAALLDSTARSRSAATADERPVPGVPDVPFAALEEGTRHRVISIGGVPYQTVTVPLRAPDMRAWVMLGFPIDDALATHLKDLTGLEVSFLSVQRHRAARLELDAARRARDRARSRASTRAHRRAAHGRRRRRARLAAAAVRRRQRRRLRRNAALESVATASYRRVRNFLSRSRAFRCCSRSAARSGSRRPSRGPCTTSPKPRGACAKASTTSRSTSARPTSSASSPAASTRCSRRSRTASGASSIRRITTACRGCRTASSSSAQLRDAIERHKTLAVVSLGLDRINGIVSSLGHRAGDEVVKLAAAALRSRLGETECSGT